MKLSNKNIELLTSLVSANIHIASTIIMLELNEDRLEQSSLALKLEYRRGLLAANQMSIELFLQAYNCYKGYAEINIENNQGVKVRVRKYQFTSDSTAIIFNEALRLNDAKY